MVEFLLSGDRWKVTSGFLVAFDIVRVYSVVALTPHFTVIATQINYDYW